MMELNDEDFLRFDPKDPIYLVGCRFSVLNAYLFVCCLQSLMAVYFCAFTILQIVLLENVFDDFWLKIYFTTKTAQISAKNENDEHFSPLLWSEHLYPAIYGRLIFLIVTFCVVNLAVFGLYRNLLIFVKMHKRWSVVYSVLLIGYVAALTWWYTIKSRNYFTFSLVAFSLFVALLVNASAINISSVCHQFMETRNKFIDFAIQQRWTNHAELNQYVHRHYSNINFSDASPCCCTCDVARRYELPRSLLYKAKREANKLYADRCSTSSESIEPKSKRSLLKPGGRQASLKRRLTGIDEEASDFDDDESANAYDEQSLSANYCDKPKEQWIKLQIKPST